MSQDDKGLVWVGRLTKMKTWDSVQSSFHFVLLLYLKYVAQRLFVGSKTHVSRHSSVKVPGRLVLSADAVEGRAPGWRSTQSGP